MKMTATMLIPAILLAGCGLGLVAAGEVNTRMKMAPEPLWRVAAREAHMRSASFTYVDPGPSDLSPHLPWIGTGPDGRIALFPEDIHGAAPYPAMDAAYDRSEDLAYAMEDTLSPEPANPAIKRAADRAAETVAALEADEIRTVATGPQTVHPAVLDKPMARPLFAGEPTVEEADELGG